jgi:hypothetical protein
MQKKMASGPESSSRVKQMMHYVKHLNQDQVDKLVESGVPVRHGTIETGDVLVTPPGWLCAAAVQKEQPLGGLRLSFLSNTAMSFKRLSTLMEINPLKQLEAIMDLLQLEQSIVPADALAQPA